MKFSDNVDYSHPQLGTLSGTVLDVLHSKHLEPCTPPISILPSIDDLPLFEDVKIADSHVQSVAHQLQGSTDPGGCDPSHWRDILLRYGAFTS